MHPNKKVIKQLPANRIPLRVPLRPQQPDDLTGQQVHRQKVALLPWQWKRQHILSPQFQAVHFFPHAKIPHSNPALNLRTDKHKNRACPEIKHAN
ncbi:hypothetical protein D3C80_1673350 [compost metagenome]